MDRNETLLKLRPSCLSVTLVFFLLVSLSVFTTSPFSSPASTYRQVTRLSCILRVQSSVTARCIGVCLFVGSSSTEHQGSQHGQMITDSPGFTTRSDDHRAPGFQSTRADDHRAFQGSQVTVRRSP